MPRIAQKRRESPRTTIAPTRHASPLAEKKHPTTIELHSLLRALIERASSGSREDPAWEHEKHDPNVLLDIEVENVRCILIRTPRPEDRKSHIVLSPREREIARMVAKGYANKTIAAVLDISSWTVGTYLRRIFAKLGVGTRAAMVAKLQQGDPIHDNMYYYLCESGPPVVPVHSSGDTT